MSSLNEKSIFTAGTAQSRRLFARGGGVWYLRGLGLLSKLKGMAGEGVSYFLLLASALLIGCLNVSNSGALWPDGAQYANAAVMIHNWILSGDLLHPYQFAQSQYAQYPAFHLPFHPPAYPFLLALFFLATGVSYISARVFVAICLGVAGCFFYAISRRMSISRVIAFGCALLLLTMPEVVRWSRDTMSEVPALAFILAGSYFFLRWVESNKFAHCLIAFGLAEMAFLSRVTTAGAVAVWFLFLILTKRASRLRSIPLWILSVLYLLINWVWMVFVSRFSKFEMGLVNQSASATGNHLLSWKTVSFYVFYLPEIVGWGTLILAVLGLIVALWFWKRDVLGKYWVIWLAASFAFLFLLRLVPEQRYFFYVLPAFPGLAAILFSKHLNKALRTWVAPGLLGLCVVGNLIQLRQIPKGVVGYDAVAQQLARAEAPGNIMSTCHETQDFIFRYQASKPNIERRVIRGDRTLAIRLSEYGGFSGGLKVKPVILAHNSEDVTDILRRGRVRYLITCVPDDLQRDDRTQEMILAHEVAQSLPNSFALYGKSPLLLAYVNEKYTVQLFVWQFLEELPAGPSELPVIVPTADLIIHSSPSGEQ